MIVFYGHGGSSNHGCEAIIRGSVSLLPEGSKVLYSSNTHTDEKYHLDELVPLYPDNYMYYTHPVKWLYYKKYRKIEDFPLIKGNIAGTYYSVGGDNYCYRNMAAILGVVNKRIRSNGNRTVLWGASIDKNALNNAEVRSDLALYDLIVSRESLTTDLLEQYGLADRCIQMPDAAFAMKPVETTLPEVFQKPVIGINLSPMILAYSVNSESIKQGYLQIINYILKNTDYNIALIPHVTNRRRNNNDLVTIKELSDSISEKKRVGIVEDMPADKLKYIISKCEFFIGARTHSTIAAYSTCVPTLVVGYSIKALGIAKDLFGSSDGYVLDVRNIQAPEMLKEGFINLFNQKEEIRTYLQGFIPGYLYGYQKAISVVEDKKLI